MGNQVSGPNDAVQSDAASVRSVVRNPIRVLRKSSTNFFKRVDSKSPLSPIPTGTVPDVQQQDPARIYATAVDGVDEINGSTLLNETQESLCSPGPRLVKVASATSAKKASSQRPLSASSTLRAPKEGDNEYFRADSRSPVVEDALVSHSHPTPSPDALALRHAVLSPTIPAPSPLPEDSPHKYGLKDRLDSPDVLEPEDLNVIKARRRSSGVDIFNVSNSESSPVGCFTALIIDVRKPSLSNQPLPFSMAGRPLVAACTPVDTPPTAPTLLVAHPQPFCRLGLPRQRYHSIATAVTTSSRPASRTLERSA